MEKLRVSGDNFFKRVGSSRGKKGVSQSNFYIPSNKSETFSNIIDTLKSDLVIIQEMINSNSDNIKMYKLLSKSPGLTKKLSEIEESKIVSVFIDKILERSKDIEKIHKIYGTKNANECIQKLFLECGLNDLLIKKVYEYFILMKLKINNDNSYKESPSRVTSIQDFMEKVPIIDNNKNLNQNNDEENDCKNEIEEILKINTLNELLDLSVENKKISPHVVKLVNNFFKTLNESIIDALSNYDIEQNNLDEINEFEGTEVDKYFKLNDITENILIEYNNKIEDLIKKDKESPNLNDEIEKINLKYETQKKELNLKIENLLKENEDLKNKINSNSDFKYTTKDLDEIKQKSLEEKKIIEEAYQEQFNISNKEIENLKIKISELEKKEEELNEKENHANTLITSLNQPIVEKIDIDEFIRKNDSDYSKNQKESNQNLDNEINELNLKIDKFTEELNLLKMEKSDLKRKLDSKQSKTFDPDSYEQVLLQQFETMKEAFIKKITKLTIEVNNVQCDSRRKTYQLEQDIKESEHLKGIFLQQIVTLQKQLGI